LVGWKYLGREAGVGAVREPPLRTSVGSSLLAMTDYKKEVEMPAPKKDEILLEILKNSAVKQYGEERAKALEPSLRDLARTLVAVEDYPLAMEEEPAFAR
jgi:hypothetical protein